MVMVAAALGVNVTEQDPDDSVQVAELKLPSPVGDALKVTVPVGVVDPVPLVSVTVTVQVEAWLITTDEVQDTVVLVLLRFTVTEEVPELVACTESPP